MLDNSDLLDRCVRSIAGMGDSPAVVVDADDCSDANVASVAAQIRAKGWAVEVLPRDGNDPAQIVISPPPPTRRSETPQAPMAAPPKPEVSPFDNALVARRTLPSESTWTTGKTIAVLLGVIIVLMVVRAC